MVWQGSGFIANYINISISVDKQRLNINCVFELYCYRPFHDYAMVKLNNGEPSTIHTNGHTHVSFNPSRSSKWYN